MLQKLEKGEDIMRSSKVRRRRPTDRRARRQPRGRRDPLMHAVGRAERAQAFPLVAKQTRIEWMSVLWDQSDHDQIPGTGEESTGMTRVGIIAILQQMNNHIPTHNPYQDVLNVMKRITCLTLVATNIRSHVLNIVVATRKNSVFRWQAKMVVPMML